MVYCEWPLSVNLGEAEAIAALARDKGVRGFDRATTYGPVYLFDRGHRRW
jgi:predicted dehydrogenase